MIKNNAIGSHQSAVMKTDVWLTDPSIIKSLGIFDLDPCSPVNRPWDTALNHYTVIDNGLVQPWHGRVWLNPPYGNYIAQWLEKMSIHNNGIALTFARTETAFFHKYIFPFASSMFFFEKRLYFYDSNGTKAKYNGGAPSVLIAYGNHNSDAISNSKLPGRHLPVNSGPVIIVGISPSWKNIISISLTRLNGEATVQEVYDMVETIAPDKVKNNPFYKEKIRQKLQLYFTRISKGIYSKSAA